MSKIKTIILSCAFAGAIGLASGGSVQAMPLGALAKGAAQTSSIALFHQVQALPPSPGARVGRGGSGRRVMRGGSGRRVGRGGFRGVVRDISLALPQTWPLGRSRMESQRWTPPTWLRVQTRLVVGPVGGCNPIDLGEGHRLTPPLMPRSGSGPRGRPSHRRFSHPDSDQLASFAANEIDEHVSVGTTVQGAPLLQLTQDDLARPRSQHNPPLVLTRQTHRWSLAGNVRSCRIEDVASLGARGRSCTTPPSGTISAMFAARHRAVLAASRQVSRCAQSCKNGS